MNYQEITTAFMRDQSHLDQVTLPRLYNDYIRERKKFKIDKQKAYFKTFRIKTKAKNNWLIFIQKSPAIERFGGLGDICYTAVTYYYAKDGLVVLRYSESMKVIEAYWGHLFTRYNERMKLNMPTTIDTIIHFFANNGHHQYLLTQKDGGRSIGVCRDGFCFGELCHNQSWLVNKTFISKEMAFAKQTGVANRLKLYFTLLSTLGFESREDFIENENVSRAIYGNLTADELRHSSQKAA